MIVLIPAYQPDDRLAAIVADLRLALPGSEELVVDDGSGQPYHDAFRRAAEAGATVIGYGANRGKGAALKSGMRWVLAHRPGTDVVTVDADGQHRVVDVVRVADAVRPGVLVLGGRRFTGSVPARSRLGNAVTRWVFRLITGDAVYDTQTGLRGYGHDVMPWLLSVPGERFEYESNVLVRAGDEGIRIVEIEIETVYDPASYSSHFRPLADSWRIYRPLLAYALRRGRR